VSKVHECSREGVVAVSESGATLVAFFVVRQAGEKTGDASGDSSKDETALCRLFAREMVGEDIGETSWSASDEVEVLICMAAVPSPVCFQFARLPMLHQLERRIGSRANLSRLTIGKTRANTSYRELACTVLLQYCFIRKPDGGKVGE